LSGRKGFGPVDKPALKAIYRDWGYTRFSFLESGWNQVPDIRWDTWLEP